jgi:hypothetical protein
VLLCWQVLEMTPQDAASGEDRRKRERADGQTAASASAGYPAGAPSLLGSTYIAAHDGGRCLMVGATKQYDVAAEQLLESGDCLFFQPECPFLSRFKVSSRSTTLHSRAPLSTDLNCHRRCCVRTERGVALSVLGARCRRGDIGGGGESSSGAVAACGGRLPAAGEWVAGGGRAYRFVLCVSSFSPHPIGVRVRHTRIAETASAHTSRRPDVGGLALTKAPVGERRTTRRSESADAAKSVGKAADAGQVAT